MTASANSPLRSAGRDLFEFSAGDTGDDRVYDFSQVGADKVDLHLIDANSAIGGDQAFAFIGTAAFTGTAGELRYAIISGSTCVYGDINGDSVADFTVQVTSATPLTSGDFMI